MVALSLVAAGCSRTEKLTIASETADCVGVGPQKCLLIKRSGNESWELWYSGIQGFTHEKGYEYVVKIRKEEVKNPPADASSVKYVLKRIVSKTKKDSDIDPK